MPMVEGPGHLRPATYMLYHRTGALTTPNVEQLRYAQLYFYVSNDSLTQIGIPSHSVIPNYSMWWNTNLRGATMMVRLRLSMRDIT